MTYSSVLPQVFSYVAFVTQEQAIEATLALMNKDRTDVPDGSSFALTVDGYGDGVNHYWKLWLSEASHWFINDCVKEGMWKHTYTQGMVQKVRETPIKWQT